jgi:hypothetical protein
VCLQKIPALKFFVFLVNNSLVLIGSSIVHWVAIRASDTHARWWLLMATTTLWHGRCSMVWQQLMAKCEMPVREDSPPCWLSIHLVGNNLASTPLKTLITMAQADMSKLTNMFPDAYMVWYDVLARATYQETVIIHAENLKNN